MYKTRLQTLKASLDSDVGNMKDITANIKKYEDKVKYVETTPQPNRSKVFELQQSNQGYGESLGVKEVQINAKQKYSTELFWRNLIWKFTL